MAAEVAATLTAPLDLVLVRKIGLPAEPELAMGAVVDGAHPVTVRNEDVIRCAAIDEAEFTAVCERELAEIERRRQRYLGDRPRVDVAGRTVVVIDDGVATGATIRTAVRAVRMRKPGRLVLAVPVAPTATLAALRQEADDVVCLEDHEAFGAIAVYYADFTQTSDQEVIDALARFSPGDAAPGRSAPESRGTGAPRRPAPGAQRASRAAPVDCGGRCGIDFPGPWSGIRSRGLKRLQRWRGRSSWTGEFAIVPPHSFSPLPFNWRRRAAPMRRSPS